MTNEDVKKNFSSITVNEEQISEMNIVFNAYSNMAITLNERLPEGRLKSIAMTKLEESLIFATKSISHK
jgi:hypothetical protein